MACACSRYWGAMPAAPGTPAAVAKPLHPAWGLGSPHLSRLQAHAALANKTRERGRGETDPIVAETVASLHGAPACGRSCCARTSECPNLQVVRSLAPTQGPSWWSPHLGHFQSPASAVANQMATLSKNFPEARSLNPWATAWLWLWPMAGMPPRPAMLPRPAMPLRPATPPTRPAVAFATGWSLVLSQSATSSAALSKISTQAAGRGAPHFLQLGLRANLGPVEHHSI